MVETFMSLWLTKENEKFFSEELSITARIGEVGRHPPLKLMKIKPADFQKGDNANPLLGGRFAWGAPGF